MSPPSPYDQGVLNRRLASLLVTAAAAGLLATGCGSSASEQAAAVRVDDRTVSRSDFEDTLEFVAENDDFRNALQFGQELTGAPTGSQNAFPQSLVGEVASLEVQTLIVAHALEENGLEVTDNDRDAADSSISSVLPEGADALPDSMRDGFLEYLAGIELLVGEFGEQGFNDVMVETFQDADISVSSRYGSWDSDEFAVVPPPGPAPAAGADTSAPELAPG